MADFRRFTSIVTCRFGLVLYCVFRLKRAHRAESMLFRWFDDGGFGVERQ
jgi:hypothetical protein